jgi:hypothetical protein
MGQKILIPIAVDECSYPNPAMNLHFHEVDVFVRELRSVSSPSRISNPVWIVLIQTSREFSRNFFHQSWQCSPPFDWHSVERIFIIQSNIHLNLNLCSISSNFTANKLLIGISYILRMEMNNWMDGKQKIKVVHSFHPPWFTGGYSFPLHLIQELVQFLRVRVGSFLHRIFDTSAPFYVSLVHRLVAGVFHLWSFSPPNQLVIQDKVEDSLHHHYLLRCVTRNNRLQVSRNFSSKLDRYKRCKICVTTFG